MPPYLHVGRFADLLQGFLDLVFAEVALAGGPGGADVIGAEGFRNGDELDIRRVPAGAAGGRVDPGPLPTGGWPRWWRPPSTRATYLMTCFSMSKFDWACLAFLPVGAIFR